MINVALRLDDPSPTSHRDVEEGVIAVLRNHGACATFAAVPFRKTSTGLLELNSNNGAHLLAAHNAGFVEIALHGHSHLPLGGETPPSEFSGLEATRQADLLSEAADHLRGLFGTSAVIGFVPPWNSYDSTTLAALEPLGFRYVSAGWPNPTDYRGPLSILPRTCQFTELPEAIEEARRYCRYAPNVVAVLHHYNFRESGAAHATLDLPAFDHLLAWLSAQSDVKLQTLGAMVETNNADSLARSLRTRACGELLPWRLRRRLPYTCLVDAPVWRILIN